MSESQNIEYKESWRNTIEAVAQRNCFKVLP